MATTKRRVAQKKPVKKPAKKKPTRAQMRVLIARDVLLGLKRRRLTAASSTWSAIDLTKKSTRVALNELLLRRKRAFGDQALYDEDLDIELRDVLKKAPNCRACGVGALFLSAVRKTDNFTVTGDRIDSYSRTTLVDLEEFLPYLKKYFPVTDLMLIEAAFEQGAGAINCDELSTTFSVHTHHFGAPGPVTSKFLEKLKDAVAWTARFHTTKKRMTEIMRNIVRNKGRFIVPSRMKKAV